MCHFHYTKQRRTSREICRLALRTSLVKEIHGRPSLRCLNSRKLEFGPVTIYKEKNNNEIYSHAFLK